MLILHIYSRVDFKVEVDKISKNVIVYSIHTGEEVGRWNCASIWDNIYNPQTGYNIKMITNVADNRVEEYIWNMKDIDTGLTVTSTRFKKIGDYAFAE